MSDTKLTKRNWADRSTQFDRDRLNIVGCIKYFEATYGENPDMAQIYSVFKNTYRYLPDIERRMRELVEKKQVEIKRENGKLKRYRVINS